MRGRLKCYLEKENKKRGRNKGKKDDWKKERRNVSIVEKGKKGNKKRRKQK